MEMTTLVILPGMDGTGLLLAPFVAELGPEFKVRVVTYPGHEPFGYADLENIARSALPEDGPFFLLGESFSGPIAVSLAAAGSARLKGVILCCSFVRNPRPRLSWLAPLLHVLPLNGVSIAAAGHLLFGRFSSIALRRKFSDAVACVAPEVLKARLRAVLAVDVSARLAELGIPILYLRAANDLLVPRTASDLVARLNRRTTIVEVQGPHFLLQCSPVVAAGTVADFMKTCPVYNPRSG